MMDCGLIVQRKLLRSMSVRRHATSYVMRDAHGDAISRVIRSLDESSYPFLDSMSMSRYMRSLVRNFPGGPRPGQPERLERGAESLYACRYVDSRAENGLTALHMAAALGDLACVKILLGAGASMMVRTVDLDMQSSLQFPAGSTPLHLAAQRGQIAILQAMLQVGVPPSA